MLQLAEVKRHRGRCDAKLAGNLTGGEPRRRVGGEAAKHLDPSFLAKRGQGGHRIDQENVRNEIFGVSTISFHIFIIIEISGPVNGRRSHQSQQKMRRRPVRWSLSNGP